MVNSTFHQILAWVVISDFQKNIRQLYFRVTSLVRVREFHSSGTQ